MKLHRPLTATFGRILLCLMLSIGCSAVSADPLLEPQLVIQRTSDILQKNLQLSEYKSDFLKATQFVDKTIDPYMDFTRVAILVLGKHWKTATDAQKERFRKEFKQLLVRTYATAFTEYADWSIRYLPLNLTPNEDKVVVKTEILQPGAPPTAVDYRMVNESGAWKVYDILIEGVSLLQNYRTTFGQEITQSGGNLDPIINRLVERNNAAMKGTGVKS
ncbi:MAG: ABC transporter substrate-binding protein [Methylococcaceae bacterium]|nr:MAG: ABC transporter substrate-binding protein [Methylococcaceae bacterium]